MQNQDRAARLREYVKGQPDVKEEKGRPRELLLKKYPLRQKRFHSLGTILKPKKQEQPKE